ncbi:hypothetical protein [Gymnodinialimonas hymeniacidonis]|uniref:hypothetical protein n=1 Tax=Gymnodinialimonas hymeniacidonis TaxID=3126508 RepID=UPI0034C66786
MRTTKVLPLLGLSLLASFPANSQQWISRYLEAESAGQLSVCYAGIDYTNAWFSTRFYGDNIDFLFFRDDFTLPYGADLGSLIFEIDGSRFLMFARTFPRDTNDTLNSAQLMQILPNNEDVVDLVTALQVGTQFTINFPDGSFYRTSLSGSNAALASAILCWDRNQTGPLQNNPFNPSEGPPTPSGGVNPFENL